MSVLKTVIKVSDDDNSDTILDISKTVNGDGQQGSTYLGCLVDKLREVQKETNAALTEIIKKSAPGGDSANAVVDDNMDEENDDDESDENEPSPSSPKKSKMIEERKDRAKWRRNLYEQTGLPDNYTPDDSFLAAIERNKNVNRFSLCQCCTNAAYVSLQLSSVFLFYMSYRCLKENIVKSTTLISIVSTLILSGYFLVREKSLRHHASDLRHILIFSAFGFGLSPLLYKLTDTISTDTIHTTSCCALLVHLMVHNYERKNSSVYASNALSLNAAFFAAVCLASRLDSNWEAFVILTMAVEAFVVFPIIRDCFDSRFILPVGVCVSTITVFLGYQVSLGLAVIELTLLFMVSFLAPWLFVRWQRYKDTIHGPWDEAVPNIVR